MGRRAVEHALSATERIETRQLGSEFEAALLEVDLIHRLRPPANRRGAHPERACYLTLTINDPVPRLVVTSQPQPGAWRLELPWTERGVIVCGDGDYDADAMACIRGLLAEVKKAAQEQGANIGQLFTVGGDPLGSRGLLDNGYSLGSLVGIAAQVGIQAGWLQRSLSDAQRAGELSTAAR